MQTFILPFPSANQSGAPGSVIHDPAIEDSGLTALIKQTFAELKPPAGIDGCIKVQPVRNSGDLLGLYFCSRADSEAYSADGEYIAPDIAVFERTDFEGFPGTEEDCKGRLEEFARRLVNGKLERANYE